MKPDMAQVNSPKHYRSDGGMEVINIIEGYGLDHHRANAVKYILRASHKGAEHQDIAKAVWYLLRRLNNHGQRPAMMALLREYRLDQDHGP